MAKHKSKEFDQLIDEAIKLGFRVRYNKDGNTILLYPPEKNYPIRTAHRGQMGVAPLENYLKKYLDFLGNKI